MKVAFITPIPDLDRFATQSKVHLVLAEHLDDERYLSFYKYRRSVGDYVILDNGAHEHDEPLPMQELMMRAIELGPNELILPDVQRESAKTQVATSKALIWLRRNRDAWGAATSPKLQIVPQGKTMDEWTRCRDVQLSAVADCGFRSPVIGIAKHHQDLIAGGLQRLVASCAYGNGLNSVHLLGWPRELYAVREIKLMFDSAVRSIDTARPFTFAKQGYQAPIAIDHKSQRYPSRDVEYFTDPVEVELRELAFSNIAWFKIQAGHG